LKGKNLNSEETLELLDLPDKMAAYHSGELFEQIHVFN